MDNDLKFDLTSSDEKLNETFESWLKDSQTYHDELLRSQKIAYQYYIGNQTDKREVPPYLSNTVENRLFEAIETLIPIVTATAHQFLILPGSENEVSLKRSEQLQKVLARKYETLEIQRKLEEVSREVILYRFAVLKYGWDEETDDLEVYKIDPRLILIPKLRLDPHKLPYVIELQSYSRSEMKEYFPKAKLDELGQVYKNIDTGESGQHSAGKEKRYQVFECWTNEMVAWFSSGKVLDKKANPYYDFEGEEITTYQGKKTLGQRRRKKTELKFYNHLERPEKPFVFFSTFNVSDGPLPTVSLADVAIPIQDSINVQKRAIINNLKQMGNGQVYVDSESMTEEEADNITNEPGQVLRGVSLASENRIRREAGVSMPNAHFANLQHSESVFDNLMGIHAATRGKAESDTLGQDILSRQQDLTRIDLLTRVLNRGVSRLANGLVQLMKLYYEEPHTVRILGEEGAVEFVNMTREEIDDHIEIIVKSGQVLAMDEVSLRNEAVQLWQLNALDPVTLYERLKLPSPEKTAERLVTWMQGQLTRETLAKIQEATAIAQNQAAIEQQLGATGGGTATGGQRGAPRPTNPTPQGPATATETPLNVLQRSRASLGGTAPVAPGTPKR